MRTKIDELISEKLQEITDELENANHHDQVNLPLDLYNSTKHLIKEEDRMEFACRIHDIFLDNI